MGRKVDLMPPLLEGPAAPLIFDENEVQLASLKIKNNSSSNNYNSSSSPWSWVKDHIAQRGHKRSEFRTLVAIFCASLGPFANRKLPPSVCPVNSAFEESSAQYIVHQYMAAVGGFSSEIRNAYAAGRITVAELADSGAAASAPPHGVGSFVLWATASDKWHVEVAAAGVRVRCGSDGKRSWRQSLRGTEWWSGPPRPPRRLLYGVEPRAVASMFSNAKLLPETASVDGHECYILRHEGDWYGGHDVVRSVMYGFFDQRSGLLLRLKDTLTLVPGSTATTASVVPCWNVTTEATLRDYRAVGFGATVVPHRGTCVTRIFGFCEEPPSRKQTGLEENWWLDDVDYNVPGLVGDFFAPPEDLNGATIISEAQELSLCSPPPPPPHRPRFALLK